MGSVRVAIVGVGNCASSLVQGVEYYKDADPAIRVPGLMHVDLGGYHVRDIEFSAAFDIDADKVGKDLSEAIFAGSSSSMRFRAERFTDTPRSRPRSRQRTIWRSARTITYSVVAEMSAVCSIIGMNVAGMSVPRVGCCQRSSASTPATLPVLRSTFGW